MSDRRGHLSIGEVLGLLQSEFPDVTISKIRFLESQGLLDPERTPSGYRKFYEGDIARLRWILYQQRDNFLPLKVIKGRLDEGVDFAEIDDDPEASASAETNPSSNGDATEHKNGVDPSSVAQPGPGTPADGEEVDRVDSGTSDDEAAILDPVEIEASSQRHPARGRPPTPSADTSVPAGPGTESSEATSAGVQTAEEPAASARPPAPEPPPNGAASEAHGDQSYSGGSDPSPKEPAAPSSSGADVTFLANADGLGGSTTGVSMDRDEVLRASGLESLELAELERYGLVQARTLGPNEFFDEDALYVAQLAKKFMAHGIEPRHLRMYRVAAEREATFFEQVVAPRLRQRDPAARADALGVLRELAELGEGLRRGLVRRSLRQYLGGE